MKLLFIPFAPSLAHVSRCLAIAEKCKEAGIDDLVFGIGEEKISFVQMAGFNAFPLPEVDSYTFKNDQGMQWLSLLYFQQNIDAEVSLIQQQNPDFIFFDFRFTTKISSIICRKPSIGIMHGNAVRLALDPSGTANDLIQQYLKNQHVKFLQKFIISRIFPLVFKSLLKKPVKKWQKIITQNIGYKINTPFELLIGDRNVICDIPSFIPEQLPEFSVISGPLFWKGWCKPVDWLTNRSGNPLIYITMGSTVESENTIIRLIEVLNDTEYEVIITADPAIKEKTKISGNIQIYPTLPGETISHQSDLVIHHGGHETLMQALKNGKPSLIIPKNPDQFLVANYVERNELGLILKRFSLLPIDNEPLLGMSDKQIMTKIYEIQKNPKYSEACKKISEEISGSCKKEWLYMILKN